MRNFFILALAFLFAFANKSFSNEWKIANNIDSNNNSNSWKCISSYDSLNIIMVGADGADIPRVIISSDAGVSWKFIYNPSLLDYLNDTSMTFAKPYAAYYDKKRIYINAWDNIEKQYYKMESFDKGNTWSKKKTDTHGYIYFDNDEGVIIDNGVVYSTINGGETWTKQAFTIPGISGDCEKIRINSLDKFQILVVDQTNQKAFLCKTSNKAIDWEVDTIPYYCRYTSFTCFDDNIIWVVGCYLNGIGDQNNDVILKSMNGGKTWQKLVDSAYADSIVSPFGLLEIETISKDEVIAVGVNRKALYTKDGGANWTIFSSGLENYIANVFYAVKFIKPNVILSCGWENLVGRYVIDSPTAVFEEFDIKSNSNISSNIVKDYLNINKTDADLISIYSANGLKVIECEYKARVDVSALASGVYFAKIGENFIKFIKQ